VRDRIGPNGATGTKKYPVVLMEFSDRSFPPQYDKSYYQNMISGTFPTGSAKDFFYENSYGKLNFTVDVYGPYTVTHTMAYYGSQDNASLMAEDILPLADPDIDFTQYMNGGSAVDMLIIIHAGLDEAATGVPSDIWSNSYPEWSAAVDGVTLRAPNTVSEATQIGAITHESGHSLGEPDYYDTTYKSMGTGEWDTMSGGTWLGDPPGSNPAHFNPLSKIDYGWATPKTVTSTSLGEMLRPSETSPDIVKVPISGSNQFFLLEYKNSTAGLFDRYIYSSGLMIWHSNPDRHDNNDPGNYMLDIEEFDYRDGTQELELNRNRAETTDPWRNDTTGMGPATQPGTSTSGGSPLQSDWLFCDIGPALSAVSLDIINLAGSDDLSIDKPELKYGDPILKGSPTALSAAVYNNGAGSLDNVVVRFYDGTPAGGLQIGADQTISSLPGYSSQEVDVPWTPHTAGFEKISTVVDPDNDITEACKNNNAQTSVYDTNFPGVVRVWQRNAPILIVDDDSGLDAQTAFESSLTALHYPFVTAMKTASASLLSKYDAVIWFTGVDRSNGALDTAETGVLRQYLDSGGMAWFSSPMLGGALFGYMSLPGADPSFFEDYLGAKDVKVAQNTGGDVTGAGDEIGGSDTYTLARVQRRPLTDTVSLATSSVGTASAVFNSPFSNLAGTKVLGNSGHGDFRSVYFGFDLIQLGFSDRVKLTEKVIDWFGLGTIYLDKDKYMLGSDTSVTIRIHDRKLNTDPYSVQTASVQIKSTSDAAGETVQLTEDSSDSSEFTGTIPVSTTKSPGVLKVAKGDEINASYIDTTTGRARFALADVDSEDYEKFAYSLSDGWNLVSIPLYLNETAIDKVFANLTGLFSQARCYDPSNVHSPWKIYSASRPPTMNTLSSIDRKMGAWVFMQTGAVLDMEGRVVSTDIPLKRGWNLIGYPSLNATRTVAEVFAGLPVDIVQTYSALDEHHIRNLAFGDAMTPGLGYWVYVRSDCTLNL